MKIYPDSSFLFSRYLTDAHSQDVDRRMNKLQHLIVTPFHSAELANAIFQWVFRGIISDADARHAYADFQKDCSTGVLTVTHQPAQTYQTAIRLAEQHVARLGVRTLDSLHVASALELKADAFWTFDRRQAGLAEAEGLRTS